MVLFSALLLFRSCVVFVVVVNTVTVVAATVCIGAVVVGVAGTVVGVVCGLNLLPHISKRFAEMVIY